MTDATKLMMLKISIGIKTAAYDARLTQLLEAASEEIEREGVTLSPDSVADDNLQIAYAAWLWNRRDTGEGMPRMVRWMLNNRRYGGGGNG